MKYLLFPVFIVIIQLVSSSKLPPELKACSKKANDYSKCLGNQIEKALRLFANGYKGLGVIPLEPIHNKYLLIQRDPGSKSMKFEFFDSTLYNMTTLKILDIKNDWKKMIFTYLIDEQVFNGTSTVGGTFHGMKLEGSGPFSVTYYNNSVEMELDFEKVKRDGKTYFHTNSYHTRIYPAKAVYDFKITEDEAKGIEITKLLNEHWKEVNDELRLGISQALADGFAQLANLVFSKIPVEELDIP